MKLRTVKKHLFREFYFENNRQVKPAQNSYILEIFSDHKKYRKPLKGLKYFFPEDKNIQKYLWEFEKEEWYELLSIYPYCKLLINLEYMQQLIVSGIKSILNK